MYRVQSFPAHDRANGCEQNTEIQRERQPPYVVEIKRDSLTPHELVAAGNLGEAGDTRPHQQPPALLLRVLVVVLPESRPGTDEAHVTDQDVPELGQLVQAPPPQYSPDARHSR